MLGIFDSGLGGLTVARAIRKRLPEYQISYLGDTARLPYGNRSAELVYQFTIEAVSFLLAHGCPLVIVACNTASALALRRLQQEWLPSHYPNARVLGVIRPMAEYTVQVSRSGRVGVVGTRSTIGSGAYVRELQAANPKIRVIQQACPLLVPLIEEGLGDRPETKKLLRTYLRPLKLERIDTLVLGCTHYPMLLQQFSEIMGPACAVPDPGKITADKLAEYLERHPEIESRLTRGTAHQFFVTDRTEHFAAIARQWMGEPVTLSVVKL